METKTRRCKNVIPQECFMLDLRELGEGVSLAGEYSLQQCLGGEGAAAFYAATLPDGGPALVKVAPAVGDGADRQLDVWQRARLLRHPHLLGLRAAGRTEIAGDLYQYAVLEYPDDHLASAIE